MNDFSEIEQELRRLRPAQPSAELVSRLASALENPGVATAGKLSREAKSWSWISLGLGAALAGIALWITATQTQTDDAQHPAQTHSFSASSAPANRAMNFRPTGLTEVVYSVRNEGLDFPRGGQPPMRRMHYETQETLRWRDPLTGASLRVSYPADEVVLTPISGQ